MNSNKILTRIEDTLRAELHVYNEENIRQTEMLADTISAIRDTQHRNDMLRPPSSAHWSDGVLLASFALGALTSSAIWIVVQL